MKACWGLSFPLAKAMKSSSSMLKVASAVPTLLLEMEPIFISLHQFENKNNRKKSTEKSEISMKMNRKSIRKEKQPEPFLKSMV